MRIDLLAANDSRPAVLNNTQRSLWRVGAILEAVAIRNVNGEKLITSSFLRDWRLAILPGHWMVSI